MGYYAQDVHYCPFCGEKIYVWHEGDTRGECENCRAQFYVIEADESERDSGMCGEYY